MPWARFDDQFPDHPKVLEAGPAAAWLHVCGICYSSRYLTDGFVPATQVKKLADVNNAAALAERLVSAGLWERCDGGYMIHDYLDYNPPAEKVKAERAAAKERMQRRRSPEVRPNETRTDAEVLEKFNDPVPVPVVPNGTTSIASDKPPRHRTRKAVPRDALTEAIGRAWRPTRDWQDLTETEQKTCARASAELFRIGATPEMVERAKSAWDTSRRWRDLTFTPDALKKHWGELSDMPYEQDDGGWTPEQWQQYHDNEGIVRHGSR